MNPYRALCLGILHRAARDWRNPGRRAEVEYYFGSADFQFHIQGADIPPDKYLKACREKTVLELNAMQRKNQSARSDAGKSHERRKAKWTPKKKEA